VNLIPSLCSRRDVIFVIIVVVATEDPESNIGSVVIPIVKCLHCSGLNVIPSLCRWFDVIFVIVIVVVVITEHPETNIGSVVIPIVEC
jgi:hypothetical protein